MCFHFLTFFYFKMLIALTELVTNILFFLEIPSACDLGYPHKREPSSMHIKLHTAKGKCVTVLSFLKWNFICGGVG